MSREHGEIVAGLIKLVVYIGAGIYFWGAIFGAGW
jgi:hypothetical protein